MAEAIKQFGLGYKLTKALCILAFLRLKLRIVLRLCMYEFENTLTPFLGCTYHPTWVRLSVDCIPNLRPLQKHWDNLRTLPGITNQPGVPVSTMIYIPTHPHPQAPHPRLDPRQVGFTHYQVVTYIYQRYFQVVKFNTEDDLGRHI